MPVFVDNDDREESRRRQLLAVQRLRRGLESFALSRDGRWSQAMAVTGNELIRELHELIAALDRRVPRVEQAGESSIARDAAALREKAVKRIAELEDQNSRPVPQTEDSTPV
jgi:hypothetical protein